MNLAVTAWVFLLLENFISMQNITPITKFSEMLLENIPEPRSQHCLQLPCQQMVNEKTIADSGSKIDAIKAEALAGGENGVWGSLLHMMALASVIRRPIFSLYPEVDFRYRPLMYKLLNPRLPRMDDEMEPVRLLWSREGSLDNRPNAWYTPNHIVPVIWIPDASSEVPQMVPGETNKSSGSKQGSILSFLKLSPANPKAPKASKGKAENSTEKRSAENAELNDGIGKQSQKK